MTPRTTRGYENARDNLDRHATYAVAAAPDPVQAQFAGTAFHPAPGPPWQRLWTRPHPMLPATGSGFRSGPEDGA